MRNRSASRQGSGSMVVERPKLKEEPHLSGAYIRSLVKKLSSSMPKGTMNPRSLDGVAGGDGEPSNLTMIGEGFSETQRRRQQEKAAQPRKQVRRRVHTSKPYQERIINMAEARREIVTALKFHRATMKRAREQQQEKLQQEEQPQAPCPPPSLQELQKERMEREDPRLYPSNNTLNMLCSYFNNPSLPSASYPPISWPYRSIAPLHIPDNLNFSLPSRPLGLNLNLQEFDNVDMNLCNKGSNPPMLSSTPSTSSSSFSYSFSSPMTSVPFPGPSSTSNAPLLASEATSKPAVGTLHPAMGAEEMAEIRLIGERHDLEWNDKLNLVKSAWWCELLKTMEEVSPQGQEAKNGGEETEGNGLCLFDEVLDVPAWLNDQQQVDGYCYNYSDGYLQDASLPCLDIGEFDGMDCEWLS